MARISLINGEANVRRGDSGDWVAAVVNAPLMVEDHLATGPNSRAEVQFDYASFLRLGGSTEAQFAELEANRYQVQVAHGTVDFSLLRTTNADIEIDTPDVSVRPKQRGNYRITVLDNGECEITVRSGQTEVYSPRGVETVGAGQTMLLRGDPANPEFQIVPAMAVDDWDRWNAERDRRLDAAGNGVYNRYVSPDIYGAQDMEGYGRWTSTPDYGQVWVPAQTSAWAPYQNGRWVWEDDYGWTWVSYDPWGWAPYHYGRWFFNGGYGGWCWWPGPIRAHYGWAPAYVGFFGFGGGGFGVGVGFGFGNVGWVPLAPFEAFRPWWGRGYYGGGYYGRNTIVNNVNVYNNYRNARVFNGVTAVRSTDFAAGRFTNRVAANATDLHAAGMVQGRLGITPSAQHLRFTDRPVSGVPRASSTNQRFFTHNQVTTGRRTPFAQTQRSMAGNIGSGNVGGGSIGTGGSYRPGTAPSITGNPAQPGLPSNSVNRPSLGNPGNNGGSSGWHRFGEPGGTTRFQNSPLATSPRGSTPSGSPSGGWQRFGSPGYNSAPRPSYSAPGGSGGRIPAAPPGVRERSTPQYSRPSTPQYSRPSTPQYSRPSGGYSAPSHSSSSPSGGHSATSHSSGGSGGHHR